MMNNHITRTSAKSMWPLLMVGLMVILVLAGCGGVPGGGGGAAATAPPEREESEPINPLPTPLPAEDVGAEAASAAKDTPEGTWTNYLRDIIAEQVSDRTQKITLLERYQDPSITAANLEGLVEDIDLVEDRTEFNTTSGGLANSNADFDIRLTYANGDTDTQTCRVQVSMEFNEDDGVWYVVNPAPLQIFAACG
jgi:hypothetical protein